MHLRMQKRHELNTKAQLLQSGGEGSVNLPDWQVNYLLKPVIASTLSAPIRIEGSLDNPRYFPDLAATLQENLKQPKVLKDTVKNLEKNLLGKDGLGGLLR